MAVACHLTMTSAGVFRGSSVDLPRIFRGAGKTVFLRLVATRWPPGGPPPGGHPVARHPVEPPEAHSAGRQAPQLEMEPVAPNDFRGVFRGSCTVACGQNLEAGGPVCFWIHDFRGGLPRIFRRSSADLPRCR